MATKAKTKPDPKKEASDVNLTLVAAPLKTVDATSSPYRVGYNIEAERAALAEFMVSPERMSDEKDPMYERYVELQDREDQLALESEKFKTRKGSEAVVEPKEFFGMSELGSLVGESVDQMTLHTLEAYRMFMGRAREPGNEAQPIIGGKRVASALRNLWALTVNDNPYAEWALLRHEQTLKEVAKRLNNDIEGVTKLLDQQRQRGLNFSILQSSAPQALNLGFKSPYGYAVATMISDFDYFVRLQKTVGRKNLRSDDQVRQSINLVTRFIRRVFNETARFDRWLMREELRGLSRMDFLPNAAPEGIKRVEFASGVFGTVPADVFSGKLQPRHSRRRIQITAAERSLLQTVSQELERGGKPLEQSSPAAQTSPDANLI